MDRTPRVVECIVLPPLYPCYCYVWLYCYCYVWPCSLPPSSPGFIIWQRNKSGHSSVPCGMPKSTVTAFDCSICTVNSRRRCFIRGKMKVNWVAIVLPYDHDIEYNKETWSQVKRTGGIPRPGMQNVKCFAMQIMYTRPGRVNCHVQRLVQWFLALNLSPLLITGWTFPC